MSAPKPSLITALRRLGASQTEVVALALLAAGVVAVVGLSWWVQRPAPGPADPAQLAVTGTPSPGLALSSGEVIVHVAGAVRSPGVYTLPGGARVTEALAAAGGPKARAVLDALNLARVLTDGEQIVVPDKSAAPTGVASGAPPSGAAAAGGVGGATVSLNQATPADLETLPNIGPVLAAGIVEYRDSIGGFTDLGQLREVPGIGEKTFQSLVGLVTL